MASTTDRSSNPTTQQLGNTSHALTWGEAKFITKFDQAPWEGQISKKGWRLTELHSTSPAGQYCRFDHRATGAALFMPFKEYETWKMAKATKVQLEVPCSLTSQPSQRFGFSETPTIGSTAEIHKRGTCTFGWTVLPYACQARLGFTLSSEPGMAYLPTEQDIDRWDELFQTPTQARDRVSPSGD